MMSKYFIVSVFFLLLFNSCTRDICDKSCAGCITLEQPFFISQDCSVYYKINDNEEIKIELDDIEDLRATGANCSSSTGGTATINFKIVHNGDVIEDDIPTVGCAGTSIPSVTGIALPSIVFDEYKLSFMKLYPISNYIEAPVDQDEYDVMLILKKM